MTKKPAMFKKISINIRKDDALRLKQLIADADKDFAGQPELFYHFTQSDIIRIAILHYHKFCFPEKYKVDELGMDIPKKDWKKKIK
jgi:hypothetical protein